MQPKEWIIVLDLVAIVVSVSLVLAKTTYIAMLIFKTGAFM
jgi:hypothetical protein